MVSPKNNRINLRGIMLYDDTTVSFKRLTSEMKVSNTVSVNRRSITLYTKSCIVQTKV